MAFVYLLAAGLPVCQAIRHTNVEIQYLKKTYDSNNLQNNGAIKEAEFWKEMTVKHHLIGHWVKGIFAPAIKQQFQLPPLKEARGALDQIPGLVQQAKDEAATTRFWSLLLLAVSLAYFGLAFAGRNKAWFSPLFALTVISVLFLAVGVVAPAMVIIVSPKTSVFPSFILHYEIRSVLGVILELYSSSYWFIGACLTVFSILIPLTKAGLTVFVLESSSHSLKLKISSFLHSISKWSMADVFVAAILLSNFAIKANKSTQANLFLGFYYFLGYCLLSLVTTTLLQKKVRDDGEAVG